MGAYEGHHLDSLQCSSKQHTIRKPKQRKKKVRWGEVTWVPRIVGEEDKEHWLWFLRFFSVFVPTAAINYGYLVYFVKFELLKINNTGHIFKLQNLVIWKRFSLYSEPVKKESYNICQWIHRRAANIK